MGEKTEITGVRSSLTIHFDITGVEPYEERGLVGAAKIWRPVLAWAEVWEARYGREELRVSGAVYVVGYRQKKTGGDYAGTNEIRFWMDGLSPSGRPVPDYVKDIITQAKAVYDQIKGVNR